MAETASTKTACLTPDDQFPCPESHWIAERPSSFLTEDGLRRVWHIDDEDNALEIEAGEMPDGLCDMGHDVRLERYIVATAARLHPPVENT